MAAKLSVTEVKKSILGLVGPLEALVGGVGQWFALGYFGISVLLDG